MSIHRLFGHFQARRRLGQAITKNRVPPVILITGPAGVGKQRLALWLAQRLFCETATSQEEPCGDCRSCRLVADLGHPDLHWIIPVPRPKSSDADKQVEEAEESITQALAERRADPLYTPPDGMASHGVASARVILKRALLTPVEGKRKVFIVGEADRLVPQESSPEAANALLKVLEEPSEDTVFILTTVDTSRILPTVRSRAAPLQLARLPDEEVESFLDEVVGDGGAASETSEVVRRARGSIGRALMDEDETTVKARTLGLAFIEAVLQPSAVSMFERALGQGAWQARGDFTAMLDAVAETLNDAAREALGHEPVGKVPPSLKGRSPDALVKASVEVREARQAAQGNVNPQLLIASLGMVLAETL